MIFRDGYADHGEALITSLESILREAPIVSSDDREAYFDTEGARQVIMARYPNLVSASAMRDFQSTVSVRYVRGWSHSQLAGADSWRFASRDSLLHIDNTYQQPRAVTISGKFITSDNRPERIDVFYGEQVRSYSVPSGGLEFREALEVAPGGLDVHFRAFGDSWVRLTDGPSKMYFRLVNAVVRDLATPTRDLEPLYTMFAPPYSIPGGAMPETYGSITAFFANGCGGDDGLAPPYWHWCGRDGHILFATTDSLRKVQFSALVTTPGAVGSEVHGRASHLFERLNGKITTVPIPPTGARVTIPLLLSREHLIDLELSTDAPRLAAPADPRSLFIRLDATNAK
jgi:hypothetical protein